MTFGYQSPNQPPNMPEIRKLGKRNIRGIIQALRLGVLREVHEQLDRVCDLMGDDYDFASFTLPGENMERVALLDGISPAPKDTLVVVHNKLIDDPNKRLARCMQVAAWAFSKEHILFQLDHVEPTDDGSWELPKWTPLLEIEDDALVVSMQTAYIDNPTVYIQSEEKMRSFPSTQEIDTLIYARSALAICTEGTLDEHVTEYYFHRPQPEEHY